MIVLTNRDAAAAPDCKELFFNHDRGVGTFRKFGMVRRFAVAAVALACCWPAAQAQVRAQTSLTAVATTSASALITRLTGYSMFVLPLDDAWDINDAGLVVGDKDGKAAVYVNGDWRYLATIAGYTQTTATAVSENGIIVGTGMSGGHQRPLIWEQGYTGPAKDMSAITSYTEPLAVNNSGHVVGYFKLPGSELTHAFRWSQDTGMVDIHPTEGYLVSGAYDISNSDYIAGYTNRGTNEIRAHRWYPNGQSGSVARGVGYNVLEDGSIYGLDGSNRATIWSANNYPTLIGPSPTTHGVSKITVSGRMVGYSNSGAWTTLNGSSVTYLPNPTGMSSAAIDANTCGTILGSVYVAVSGNATYKPVLWGKGTCDQPVRSTVLSR